MENSSRRDEQRHVQRTFSRTAAYSEATSRSIPEAAYPLVPRIQPRSFGCDEWRRVQRHKLVTSLTVEICRVERQASAEPHWLTWF